MKYFCRLLEENDDVNLLQCIIKLLLKLQLIRECIFNNLILLSFYVADKYVCHVLFSNIVHSIVLCTLFTCLRHTRLLEYKIVSSREGVVIV